jgi:hypothetical protein
MARTDAPGVMTSKPLIESDRVEGTAVYDRNDNHIGSTKRLMIEKKSGQVAYIVFMRPKERRQAGQSDLFRARLDQIVDRALATEHRPERAQGSRVPPDPPWRALTGGLSFATAPTKPPGRAFVLARCVDSPLR